MARTWGAASPRPPVTSGIPTQEAEPARDEHHARARRRLAQHLFHRGGVEEFFRSAPSGISPQNIRNYLSDLPAAVPVVAVESIYRGNTAHEYWKVA